jgi:serine/threonine protein kinase
MKQIEDITLIKLLGKGSYGEVYLSKKKGRNEYFATKKMGEGKIDKYNTKIYIESEIELLKILRHPNIIGFEGYKMTKDCFYITMEFANGGSLSDCLIKYQAKYGKAFSEEIIQHLMRQIISALKFIHSKKVIHRDLKLDNIMASFDNENDKNNVNMLRAKVKIIDFGTAIKVGPNNLATTIVGSPINMDPAILKKYQNMMSNKAIRDPKQPYDEKVDIWSIGTACYQMLIGKPCFDAESMDELVTKIEQGTYSVPTTISKEMVSFLNGMLQYESDKRLSSEELENHPFLKKKVRDFEKIDIERVKRKIDNKGLNINVKKNQTIWSIFNEKDEQMFVNINPYEKPNGPLLVYNNNDDIMKTNTVKPKNRQIQYNIPINKKNGRSNSSNYNKKNGLGLQNSPIYGKNIYGGQNGPRMQSNAMFQSDQGSNYGFVQNNLNFPTFGVPSQNLYGDNNTPNFTNNIPNLQNNNYINNYISPSQSNYRPMDNELVDEDDKGSGCLIQ